MRGLPSLALALAFALAPSSAFAAPQATRTYTPEADTYVRERLGTSQYSNTQLPTGRGGSGGPIHRSFVRFNQGGVDDLRSKNVVSAQLRLYAIKAGACDRRVDARRLTSGFGSSTVWTNQPASSYVEGTSTQGAGGPTCAAGWIQMPVSKATVDGWADGLVPNHGLLLRAGNEYDGFAWRTFSSLESGSDPQLVVTYNTAPRVPGLISPAADASGACDPTLSASFSDLEGGEGRVDFQVLDSAGSLVVGGSENSTSGTSNWKVPRNADGSCKLKEGQTYSWRARAYDGRDYSGWSAGRSYSIPSAPASDVIFDGAKSASWSDWHACAASRFGDLASDPTGIWPGPVIRFEVRNSDTSTNAACVDEPTDNPRTQLLGPDHVEGDAIDRTGDTASVVFDGFSVFIPASWPASISEWIALHSNFGPPYNGPSDVGIRLTDGTLRSPDTNGAYNWQPAWSTPMSGLRGHWVNIVQEVKRSHDEKVGYVRQWYSTDRSALTPTTFTGPGCASVSSDARTCYRTTFGPAMDDGKLSPRIGLYHSKTITTPDPMVTYYRAFKQGKTLGSVDPTKAP